MPSSRREFVRLCTLAAASIGLGPLAAQRFVEAAAKGLRPSVIWLQFQECTGCTESLLRTSHPAVDDLIFDLISLDYHETLFAAAGHQAEAALKQAMRTNAGKYVCVVEGAIPTKENGIYCMIGGRTALDIVQDVAGQAGAVIAIGSCASWGGIPSADPNPTGAVGAHEVLKGKTVVNIPGCPANPYNLLGTVLQYATYGTLPALDAEGPAEVRVRPDDSRALSAARALRCRPLRGEVRRRGPPDRLLPLQARMQGAGDARELLGPAFRRRRRRVADRARASLLRLHRAEDRVPRAAPHDGRDPAPDAARHLRADSRAAGRREPCRHGGRWRHRRRARGRGVRGVEEAFSGRPRRKTAAAARPSSLRRRCSDGHLQTRGAQRPGGGWRGGRRRTARTGGHSSRAADRRPGTALRRHALHRLQDLHGRVQRGQRSAGRHLGQPGEAVSQADRSQREGEDRHQAVCAKTASNRS